MIEVLLVENGLYRWHMICEQGRIIVFGTDHITDHEANFHGKQYRNLFWSIAKYIDYYPH